MKIILSSDLGKLIKHMQQNGIKVDAKARGVLEYFEKRSIEYFFPKESTETKIDVISILCDVLNMKKETLEKVVPDLEKSGIIGQKSKIVTVGGTEYQYGIRDHVKPIYEVYQVKS